MHEIDLLTMMSLAEHEPERTLFLKAPTGLWLMHAKCMVLYKSTLSRSKPRLAVLVPEGTDAQLEKPACTHCGRAVQTLNLKPF